MLQYLLFPENLLLIKIQDGMRSMCMYVGVKGRGDDPDESNIIRKILKNGRGGRKSKKMR